MKTLLHICCAPCANQPIQVLRTDGIEVAGFWYNPNIHPVTENRARRSCLEDYAKQNDMKVVETIFKDDRAIDKLTYYIEREGIICILVRSIWDISTDRETVKSIMKLAAEHNVSINEENRGFEPATLVWDGGAGC